MRIKRMVKLEKLLGFRNVNARDARRGIERSGAAKVGEKGVNLCKISPRKNA